MEYSSLIKQRYSVRSFDKAKEVETEKLNKIFEAGQVAPTAKNLQSPKIYVLKSKEAIEKIEELSPCTYNAPIVMLVCYDKNIVWNNPFSGQNSGVEDASIVCTHMMLEAYNQGLGSCWANYFDYSKVKEAFKLGENIEPVTLLAIGYPTENSKPNPINHFNYKKIDELFEIL